MDDIPLSTTYKYCYIDYEGITEPIEAICSAGTKISDDNVLFGWQRPQCASSEKTKTAEPFGFCWVIAY